jgi:hypothetical protein
MMSHTSDNSIVRDYCHFSLQWTETENLNRKNTFEFDIPISMTSSSQFGKLIKVKLIQSGIRYSYFNTPVSIYAKGFDTRNFYGSDPQTDNMILLSLSGGSTGFVLNERTPEYVISKIPQKITIVLKDEVNYDSELQEEFNQYEASNLLLEFSYYTDTLNFNDAHTKMMNF